MDLKSHPDHRLRRNPTMVDLFAGAGGLSAGFATEGFALTGAVENWDIAAESLKANHADAFVESGDIRQVPASEFLSQLPRSPNLVLGGPSCQGFSTSGGLSRQGRNLGDERNSLFLDFVRFVDALRPEWVVMENVPGLLLFRRGAVAKAVINEFRSIGYQVAPMILLAADFGVPQLRRRLFFVGNRTGSAVPFPVPTHGNPALWNDFALPFEHLSRIGNKTSRGPMTEAHVSFEDACGDLPLILPGAPLPGPSTYGSAASTEYQRWVRQGSPDLTLHVAFEPSDFERRAIPHLAPGDNWRALPAELISGRFARIRHYDATTLMKRLVADKPAYTINTKFNDATSGAYIHPSQNRTLSLREGARLQSFRDSYVFRGTPPQVRKQIGNAVPPLLAAALARAIRGQVCRDAGLGSPGEEPATMLVDPGGDIDELLGLKTAARKRSSIPGQLEMLSNP